MTLDTYSHLFNDDLQGVADRLDTNRLDAGWDPVGTQSGGAQVLNFNKQPLARPNA
jgi:hypothetical protein